MKSRHVSRMPAAKQVLANCWAALPVDKGLFSRRVLVDLGVRGSGSGWRGAAGVRVKSFWRPQGVGVPKVMVVECGTKGVLLVRWAAGGSSGLQVGIRVDDGKISMPVPNLQMYRHKPNHHIRWSIIINVSLPRKTNRYF